MAPWSTLATFFDSKRARQLSALSMLAEAAKAFKRGKVVLAGLYVVGAGLSYKNSKVGFGAQALLRLLRRRAGDSGASSVSA